MKPEIENLKVWMSGKSTTGYQRALAMREFEQLLIYVAELEQLRQPPVSCRAFVLERAKKHLGSKFKHFGTGQTLEEGYFTWSVSVSKFFGGMHVAYGGWVVWSACDGWLAEPCR